MSLDKRYDDWRETEKLLNRLQVKIGAMEDRLQDFDPEQVAKLVKLLRKAVKLSFYRND